MNNTFFFVIVVLLSISGLGMSFEGDSPSYPVTVTEADSGKTIHVRQNQILTVCLQGNRTTGYRWEVVHALELDRQGRPELVNDSGIIGSGGTFRYFFKVAAPGTGNLKMVYRRPWETDVAPLKSFEIFIVIDE